MESTIKVVDGYVYKGDNPLTLQKVQMMYLDYTNNFISSFAFADHYGIKNHQALAIIEQGRVIQEAFAELHKELKSTNS